MARSRRCSALAALWLALFARGAQAETYEARAIHLRDGDSLIVRAGDRQRELRIEEIDAPERGQPWSQRSERALAQLVEGRSLRVEFVELDRYGREISRIWVGGTCVGCEMVRSGNAWAYRKYLHTQELLALERAARDARRGLWSLPAEQQVPPWEWRAAEREGRAPRPEASAGSTSDASSPFGCGAKRYCKEMGSCAEARFHLERCGLTRLDGDGNGVPCEGLCVEAR